ncbi:hypothetical protein H6P81_003751 [Aristolochia fimbriata]|uniref:Protein RTE1-HOMOLOG n=1 Tax=Aristolochia fimbriata TaxID=158543 RepID=A0AAV7FHF0_ARIFI|nr:hypothetical protein H6P81_003751 [Aristolochia fimbriata]
MDSAVAIDCELMLDRSSLPNEIDAKRARFPCCIVWTPLPVLSWFIPFIGHIGICREDGVILDFAGPNFVCVDNFAFGAAARFIQIRKEQCLLLSEPDKEMTWDDAIRKSTQEFQHKAYSLFTCNCHSFVANNLNRLCYGGRNRWNVVNLAVLIFLKGRWVNKSAIIRSYLPFVIVFSLGILLGSRTFLTCLTAFSFVLVCWFIVGTYCLKNLIQL